MKKTFYTVGEAARLIGRNEDTVRRYIATGDLISKRGPRNCHLIQHDSITRFLNEMRKKSKTHEPAPDNANDGSVSVDPAVQTVASPVKLPIKSTIMDPIGMWSAAGIAFTQECIECNSRLIRDLLSCCWRVP